MTVTKSEIYNSDETVYQESLKDPITSNEFEAKVGNEKTFLVSIQTIFLRFGECLARFRLEIVTFLYTFSYIMTGVSSTAMIMEKICSVHFNFPSYICSDLENHTENKTSVEKLAANYQLAHTLIQIVPAAVLACFIGPWSDYYGRKFPIMLAIFGMILDALGSSVCAYFLETRVEYYFIPAIFTGFLGGQVSILAVVHSYASDMTPVMRRTMKYAFLEMATGFAMPFGTVTGGWIYNFLGYPAVFIVSSGGLFLSLVWVIFLLKETRGLDNNDPWAVKLRILFSCESFKESFRATTIERPHQGRKQILLLILSISFIIITTLSTGGIDYLYAHNQFGWNNTTFSTISALYSVIAIFVLFIVIPLLKYYKAGDPIIGLIGTISLLGQNLGLGLAWKTGIYHAANIFGLLGPCALFAVRSRISKVVTNDDLGKVFSFVATAETFLPILATILMSQIFNAFLDIFPGMPYIVLTVFLFIPLGVYLWMSYLPKITYEEINQSSEA